MTKTIVMIGACATLLWAGTALATATPQQKCDYQRITAWKKYVSCVESAVAKMVRDSDGDFDQSTACAKCRHTYFRKWNGFQARATLATSSCRPNGGARFVDNLDGTVTDNLTTLVWEKKTNDASVHDVSNTYSWSTGSNREDGTAFTSFLPTINGGGFAGSNGWRLPTLGELQSIVLDFPCTGYEGGPSCVCATSPCIDATFGLAQPDVYWCPTSYFPNPIYAWGVHFFGGYVSAFRETDAVYARAVRGGF